MPIFRSELNRLVQVLLNENFASKGFELDQDLSDTGLIVELPLKVTHNVTGFYFEVGPLKNVFRVECFPGTKASVAVMNYSTWNDVLRESRRWMSRVVRELGEPNPWVLLNQGNILTDELPSSTQGLEKLDSADLIKVEGFVTAIREFIVSESAPREEQLKRIDEKLQYLLDSATRQSKQDWAHTAVGVVFSIAIGLAMAPDQANRLFQLTAALLKTFFIRLLV